MKHIIGIIGPIASGKDTLADYLSAKLKWPIFATSSVLKKIARSQNVSINRDNLMVLGRKIAKEKGGDYLAKTMLSQVKNNAILTGMRQVEQINYLKKNSQLTLISIDTNLKRRFERAHKRNKAGEADTLNEFIKNEKIENSNYQAQQIYKCMAMADFHIENSGTLQDLHKQANKIIKNIGKIKEPA